MLNITKRFVTMPVHYVCVRFGIYATLSSLSAGFDLGTRAIHFGTHLEPKCDLGFLEARCPRFLTDLLSLVGGATNGQKLNTLCVVFGNSYAAEHLLARYQEGSLIGGAWRCLLAVDKLDD